MSSLDLDRTSDSSTEPIYSPDFADMAMFLAQQDSFPPSHISGQLFPASETESNFAAASSVEDLQIIDVAGSSENTTFTCSREFSDECPFVWKHHSSWVSLDTYTPTTRSWPIFQ